MYLETAVHISHWHFKDIIWRTEPYSHASVNSEQWSRRLGLYGYRESLGERKGGNEPSEQYSPEKKKNKDEKNKVPCRVPTWHYPTQGLLLDAYQFNGPKKLLFTSSHSFKHWASSLLTYQYIFLVTVFIPGPVTSSKHGYFNNILIITFLLAKSWVCKHSLEDYWKMCWIPTSNPLPGPSPQSHLSKPMSEAHSVAMLYESWEVRQFSYKRHLKLLN